MKVGFLGGPARCAPREKRYEPSPPSDCMLKTSTRNLKKTSLANATSYAEWASAAQNLDETSGRANWRAQEADSRFDYRRIRKRLDGLRSARHSETPRDVLFALNEGIHGNLGGIANPRLYNHCLFGTKHLIEEYIEEVTLALDYLAGVSEAEIPYEERLDFFRRASHCYGRSALMLSGAGSRTPYHFGVVRALHEEGLLPNIISGSSGGAIVAGMAGSVARAELSEKLSSDALVAMHHAVTPPDNGVDLLHRPIRNEKLVELVDHFIPDLTFEEAYEVSGLHINISVASDQAYQKSRLLNAITTPHVYLREAVRASCSVPGVFPSVTLASQDHNGHRKPYLPELKWIDGSITDDLPARRLGRLYGVNHFIASQTNPAVLWGLRDLTQTSPPVKIALGWANDIWKANLRATRPIAHTMAKRIKGVGSLNHILYSVALQQYTADINILPSQRLIDPRKVLSHISLEDSMALYEDGQRVTWPKIEMVRNTTMISRRLDDILDQYEHATDTQRFRYKKSTTGADR